MKVPHLAITALVAVALAACGGQGSGTQATTTPSAGPRPAYSAPAVPAGAVMVDLVDYSIEPATLAARAGHLTFYVTNKGKTPHNFSIRAASRVILATPNLSQGQSAVLEADLRGPAYQYICTQPGHESLGMLGTLTVGG